MVRVALIGTGGMGKKYLKRICRNEVPLMECTAAVARSAVNQEYVKEVGGDRVLICASEDELYEHSDLFDAVIIATPHKLHPAMAIRAFENGKHVLLEKPIGISVGACEELLETAKNSGKVFSVVFHQRAYPKYMAIKQMLDQGEIGTVTRVLMENTRYFRTEFYHRSGTWRSSWNGEGGGALINQGQHILDIWQWLFGMPDTINAQIGFGKYNDFLVDDEATILMHYPDGKSGIFFLSTGEGTNVERLEIAGTKGTILMENDTVILHKYNKDLNEYRATETVTARDNLLETTLTREYPLEAETQHLILENFAKAVEEGAQLIVDGQSAVNALELTNAAYLSAWLNKPVELPADAALYEAELEKQKATENAKAG